MKRSRKAREEPNAPDSDFIVVKRPRLDTIPSNNVSKRHGLSARAKLQPSRSLRLTKIDPKISDPKILQSLLKCILPRSLVISGISGAGDAHVDIEFSTMAMARKAGELLANLTWSKICGRDTSNDLSLFKVTFRAVERARESNKAARLIVRNLPFSMVAADDLKQIFDKFGAISDCTLPLAPRSEGDNSSERSRGFGFVQFSKLKCAEAVMRRYQRELKDWIELGKKQTTSPSILFYDNRQIAIDWAIGREEFEEFKSSSDNQECLVTLDKEQLGVIVKDTEFVKGIFGPCSDEENRCTGEPETKSIDEPERVVLNVSAEEHMSTAENGQREIKNSSTQPSDVLEGKTLFVRGVPYSATEDQLKEVFGQRGRVVVAKIVKSKTTGQSMGTGFVKMASRAVVQELLEEDEAAHQAAILARARPRKFGSGSIGLEGAGLTMGGRRLFLSLALKPEAVEEAKRERAASAIEKKRLSKNSHLLREGYIDPESAEFKRLSPSEKRRREESFKERQTKIQNSNFFVNPLCLCFRNLPSVTDATQLRSAIVECLLRDPAFEEYLLAKGSEIEKARHQLNSDSPANHEYSMKRRKRITEFCLGKIRMVVDKTRSLSKDTVGRIKRSRGFAFVNFLTHEAALMCLRCMNNRKDVFGKERRLIVEFAVEDRRALHVLEEKGKHSKVKAECKARLGLRSRKVLKGRSWKK